jgi:deazaflavin-dependent oxidoreductase (nitroreductase family)
MTSRVYRRPGFATKHVFNPLMECATRLGLSMAGSRVLEVQGRKSGKWFSTPVNLLPFEGQRYLVAPRGETQWVRNIRASGGGRLRLGRRTETIHVAEVPDAEKTPILRAYLKKWAWETGVFFGVEKNPSDDELARIAPNHPVFRIETVSAGG